MLDKPKPDPPPQSWLGEFASFMWECKWYWIIPMVLMVVLFIVLIITQNLTGDAPFRYTLF